MKKNRKVARCARDKRGSVTIFKSCDVVRKSLDALVSMCVTYITNHCSCWGIEEEWNRLVEGEREVLVVISFRVSSTVFK